VAGGLFRTKSVEQLTADSAGTGEATLKPTLSAMALVALGIGAIIGAGLFVRTAAAIAERSGPSVTLAFIVAGVGCAFAGLCYAEFASMVPIAGSAYTYSYLTMGELVAWIIGWDLILEYAVGAATVAIAWSEYFNRVLGFFGTGIPWAWTHSPMQTLAETGERGIMNLPAVFILLILSLLLIRGTQQSAWVNNLIVITKVAIVLLVIVIGWQFINPANHTPYIPDPVPFTTPQGTTHTYGGIMGILGAAGVVFFAYIGFDAVSTAAQEAKNPKRDMPIGILGSLVICTILYVLFAHVLSGVASVEDFRSTGREASVAFAISKYMTGYEWLSRFVTVAILAGFSSVILVMLLGQSRVFYSMARDGLVPSVFSDIPHAVEVEHDLLRAHGAVCGVHSGRHRRRDDQHRHPVRFHARLRRRLDSAAPPSGSAAGLPHPRGTGGLDARHRGLRRNDLRAGLDELAAAHRLARDRPGSVLRLWPQSLQARTRWRRVGRPADPLASLRNGASSLAPFPFLSMSHRDFFTISSERRAGIERIARELRSGKRVALSTHINADGDGCGSEAGLARMLAQRGMKVHIVNPTPWPDLFDFLLGDDVPSAPRGARR
jgi:basic amino acid/polyamine antiporter, APA family